MDRLERKSYNYFNRDAAVSIGNIAIRANSECCNITRFLNSARWINENENYENFKKGEQNCEFVW